MEQATNNALVLVTGGTGFLGTECILQLLRAGYRVRTTLRDIARRDKVLSALANGGLAGFSGLEFFEAELLSDRNWGEAMAGCDFVLHVASPISRAHAKTDDEFTKPAVEGTLRVLKAATAAGVRRVVLTSSFGAVGYSHKDPRTWITEAEWTDAGDKSLSPYVRSKTLAERAAWDYVEHTAGAPELSVINPVGIFGPSLGPDLSGGFEILKGLLDGSMKAMPRIKFGIVDVRDVAELHLRAMTRPEAAGERFLAVAGDEMTLRGIAGLLRQKLGAGASRVPELEMPDWLVRLLARFMPGMRAVVPMLNRAKKISNEKARRVLGWAPRSNEAALLATAESLFRYGAVKQPA